MSALRVMYSTRGRRICNLEHSLKALCGENVWTKGSIGRKKRKKVVLNSNLI